MRKLLLVGLAVAAGCTPDLARDEPGDYVVALFDPAAAVPVVPLPNDLAIDAKTGLVAIPDSPTATEAEKQFNAYLRTLDGFPTQATATAPFSAALDPATVTAENVRILDTTDPANVTTLQPTELKFDAAKKELQVKAKWDRARKYAIAVIGGESGVKGANGEQVVGSPAVLLVRAQTPLVSCADLASKDCKPSSSLITGATEDEKRLKAVKLEVYRRELEPAVKYLESNGVSNTVIAGLWGFRTVKQPLATFDPKEKIVPFPNDLLMANGKVNLPVDPADDAQTASLKLLLNDLDGFSTTASILTELGRETGATNGRIDALTIGASQFALVNLGNTSELINLKVTCRSCGSGTTPPGTEPDQLALVPEQPLRSHTRYAVYWFKGARELNGAGFVNTGSIFALMRLSAPIWANNASMVPSVDVLTAALLEPLRVQTQELLAITDAKGIERQDVLMAWSFTTQTTTEPIVDLAGKPAQWNLPTNVTGVASQDFSALTLATQFTGYDWHTQVRAMYEGYFTSGNALTAGQELDPLTGQMVDADVQFTATTLATPRQEQLKFLLCLPKTPKYSDGRIPVIIFQHGLTGHRRNAAAIANSAAKKGYAVLAIDAPFHGERSYCRANSECMTGTQCVNHRCPGGYASNDQFTQTPTISGLNFASATNPFATRDRFRQQVIDFAQLIRVLKDTTNGIGGLSVVDNTATTVVERLETSEVRYIGQSLGGILGTVATAAIPEIKASTLNVPGADPVSIILTSQGFAAQKTQLDNYLAGRGIPTGSQRYEEFMDTARWVLDPADPQNYGRHLIAQPLPGRNPKRVFVSWVEGDEVVPNPTTRQLINSIVVGNLPQNFSQNMYVMNPVANAHVFMLDLSRGAVAAGAQNDAINWVDQ